MRNYRRAELAKEILTVIGSLGVVGGSLILPELPRILKMLKVGNWSEEYRLRRTLKNLERNELIRIMTKNGKEVVEITTKGKYKLLSYDFDDLVIKKPKKWDGKWRLVIFDISNDKNKRRRLLSFKLLDLGFQLWQKSIYIYPYPCDKEIDFIRGFLKIGDEVKYIEATSIPEPDDRHFQKSFNL